MLNWNEILKNQKFMVNEVDIIREVRIKKNNTLYTYNLDF